MSSYVIELDEAALGEALVESFVGQIVASRAAGRLGVPLLVLDDSVAVRRGRCLSCGIPAAGWRCDECLAAIELALADGEGEQLVLRPSPLVNPLLVEIEENARERDLWRIEA